MRIFVSTTFSAVHQYPDAPDDVRFLRSPHRHRFHIRAEMGVHHDDRELEFLLVQREVDALLDALGHNFGTRSCEQVAGYLLDGLRAAYGDRFYQVEVSEDGENGAIVSWSPPTGTLL